MQGLLDLVRTRRWHLALDVLVYFAHWVTKEGETRRFETRLFIAPCSPDQVATPDAAKHGYARRMPPR